MDEKKGKRERMRFKARKVKAKQQEALVAQLLVVDITP
jgi:hypothetical protein